MSLLKRCTAAITNRPYWWMYAIGIVILLLSVWLWWTRVHLSPNRVFWGMIDQSLSTKSVTIQTTQGDGQNDVRQLMQFELGTTNKAHSLTTLTQGGGSTVVKTEMIGTPTTDYVRYSSIKTDQKGTDGQDLDLSKIVGVWTKSDPVVQSPTQSSGQQLFAQAVLGIGLPVGSVPVPIGELPAQARDDLVRQIREQRVYETSFKDAKKKRVNGRIQYTYTVKIQTILYVRLMQAFAAKVGLEELKDVDPNVYQTSAPLEVKLVVDAQSRQLVAVERADGVTQRYTGYGLPLSVTVPDKTITSTQLQERLNSL